MDMRKLLVALACVLAIGPQMAFAQPASDAAAPSTPDGGDGAEGDGTDEGPAEADDEAARRHFRLGQAYYENGQFAEAATEFEQAYQLSGRSVLLYNVYLSHRDALHTRQSYEALRQYLDEVPNPPDEDRLRARLAHLERALAGQPETTEPETTEPETTEPETTEPVTAPDPTETAEESSSPLPIAVMAGGGGLMLGGVVAALISRGARSDLDSICNEDGACPPDSNWESLVSKGQRSARAADVMLGVGAVAAVSGVVLYFVMSPDDDDTASEGDDDDSRASVRPGFACDQTGCMATVGGQF